MYQLVIFDLDGTLLDTLEDLKNSVNYALGTQQLPPRTLDEVRRFVGNGIRNLCERAVPAGTPAEVTDAVFAAFNPHYAVHCADYTKPYAGALAVMEQLRRDGAQLAVVSNKSDYAVQTLAAQSFPGLLDAAAGAKDGVRKKPYPDAVFAVMEQLHADRAGTVYIGDSEVDIETAKNAGLPCISVSWGFRSRQLLEQAGASCICEDMQQMYRAIQAG